MATWMQIDVQDQRSEIFNFLGFHKWGYPHSWMVFVRENPMKMDENWGYPYDETETSNDVQFFCSIVTPKVISRQIFHDFPRFNDVSPIISIISCASGAPRTHAAGWNAFLRPPWRKFTACRENVTGRTAISLGLQWGMSQVKFSINYHVFWMFWCKRKITKGYQPELTGFPSNPLVNGKLSYIFRVKAAVKIFWTQPYWSMLKGLQRLRPEPWGWPVSLGSTIHHLPSLLV